MAACGIHRLFAEATARQWTRVAAARALHARRRLFAGWRPTIRFPEVIGKSAMPALDVSTTTPTRETASTPVEITCEPATGEEAQDLILRLGCALARLAAREDDARENAGSVVKRE